MDGAADGPVQFVSWAFVPSKQRLATKMRCICGTSTSIGGRLNAYKWIDEWTIDTTGKWRIHLSSHMNQNGKKTNRFGVDAATVTQTHVRTQFREHDHFIHVQVLFDIDQSEFQIALVFVCGFFSCS